MARLGTEQRKTAREYMGKSDGDDYTMATSNHESTRKDEGASSGEQ